MREFLEQLGFEDITPDNPFDMKYPLNEYFDLDKPFHAFYRRVADNGIITYIGHRVEGDTHHIDIVSNYGLKGVKAQQLAPGKYIKDLTLDLLLRAETTILRL